MPFSVFHTPDHSGARLQKSVMGKMDRDWKNQREYRSPSRLDIKRAKSPPPTVSDGGRERTPNQRLRI